MARKNKAVAEEIKEEINTEPVNESADTIPCVKAETKEEPKPEKADPLEERVKALEVIVKNFAERIAKLEKNAPKRLTSADFCGM